MKIYWVHISDADKEKVRNWVTATLGEENDAFLDYPWPYEVWILFLEFLEDLGVGRLFYKEICKCCGPELHFDVTDPYAYPFEYLKLLEDTNMYDVRQFFVRKIMSSDMFDAEKYTHLASFTSHSLSLPRLISAHFFHKKTNLKKQER